MGIARSTFYDRPDTGADDATVVAQMKSICDDFEAYGYRRASSSWPCGEHQEGPPADARACAQSAAAQPFHRDDRQRSQRSDLPQSCDDHDIRWSEPALGG